MIFRFFALMMPALMPSWRFFDVVAPSPRVHFRLWTAGDSEHEWQEFDPRPVHVSIPVLLARMVWNPRWNEQLFVVSCAERVLDRHTDGAEFEIARRIVRRLTVEQMLSTTRLQFRLIVVERADGALKSYEAFVSRTFDLRELC